MVCSYYTSSSDCSFMNHTNGAIFFKIARRYFDTVRLSGLRGFFFFIYASLLRDFIFQIEIFRCATIFVPGQNLFRLLFLFHGGCLMSQ